MANVEEMRQRAERERLAAPDVETLRERAEAAELEALVAEREAEDALETWRDQPEWGMYNEATNPVGLAHLNVRAQMLRHLAGLAVYRYCAAVERATDPVWAQGTQSEADRAAARIAGDALP